MDGVITSLDLPASWTAREPAAADVDDLHALLARHEVAARGGTSASAEGVAVDVTGAGAGARRHVVLQHEGAPVQAWATVHDRAAGRSLVSVAVDPDLKPDVADRLAQELFGWARAEVLRIGVERGVSETQVDSGAFADDARQQRWLQQAGLEQVRSWWQMSRPVAPQEASELPDPGPGVVIRSVAHEEGQMPLESDLTAMHDILETSFTDHFNYHEETFDEFVSRLREDPGHRWDHWWIAELEQDEGPLPVGALVGAVSGDASYVEYLGVLRTARGRGVASSLLRAVIADAAERGRPTVGIEVDQDSSTGAADLYLSMGFVTTYVTQSWHLDLRVG